ncbi:MAG: hypothetical protein AB7U98_01470 [Candidatus Nitrosocosmicus sp.]
MADFKNKYYSLLDKSLNHPDIMNVIRKLNLRDSSKENDKIILATYTNSLKEHIKALKIFKKRRSMMIRLNNPFFGKKLRKEKEFTKSEGTFAVYKVPKNVINKSDKYAKRNLALISRINSLDNKYMYHIKKSGYAVLTILPIDIFILLVQFIILKSTAVWPSIINDKEALFKLNRYVYEEIIDINSQLTKYLSKSNRNLQISKIVELNDYRISRDTDDLVREIYDIYSILGMEGEIKNVFESFNIIRKKDVDYNIEHKFMDIVKENSKLALELKNEKS